MIFVKEGLTSYISYLKQYYVNLSRCETVLAECPFIEFLGSVASVGLSFLV